jgi:hypothetical protein
MTNTVNNKVLQEILEKSSASTGMYVQKVYKDTLRNLINIFSNVYYLDRNNNSVKVKCFHANQERAIARSTFGDNVTLPVITISEESTSNNDERRRYTPILIHEKYWHKRKNKALRSLSMAPRPIDIKYTINIWSKYKEDLDQIREFIFSLFNPDLEIRTKNSIITKAFLDSESQTEQAQADDQQDRILKKSITITVETYVENPKFLYTSTGKIERLNFELEITDTDISETATAESTTTTKVVHADECLCSQCVLPIETIFGTEFNLPVNCDPLSDL